MQKFQASRHCSVGTSVLRQLCLPCIRHGSLQHQAAQSGHGSRQHQAAQSAHGSRQLQALETSYREIEQKTPTHETFWMLNPPSGVTAGSVAYPADVPDDLPHASIQSLNHTAIGVQDLAAMRRFYVEVSSPGAGLIHWGSCMCSTASTYSACRFCSFVSWPGQTSPLMGHGWRQVRWRQPPRLAAAVSHS